MFDFSNKALAQPLLRVLAFLKGFLCFSSLIVKERVSMGYNFMMRWPGWPWKKPGLRHSVVADDLAEADGRRRWWRQRLLGCLQRPHLRPK